MILLLRQILDYSKGVIHSLAWYLDSSVTSVMLVIDKLAKWTFASPEQQFLLPLFTECTQVIRAFYICMFTVKEALISGSPGTTRWKWKVVSFQICIFRGKKQNGVRPKKMHIICTVPTFWVTFTLLIPKNQD